MKNVLLILTGGTIGSFCENGIITTQKQKCRILELYQKYGPEKDIFFEVHQPMNILSENLNIHHWELLLNNILKTDLTKYNGIIITHGSDTLSYTSALLGLCLNSLNIPIVITASNYIPDDKKSNALANFSACVNIICSVKKGVYTVFKNEGEEKTAVYIPTRITEADRFLDQFSSFDGKPYCYAEENPSFQPLLSNSGKLFDEIKFKNSVMVLRPYPSLDYQNIIIPENTKAVLHITYHSATLSTEGKNSALSLLKQCQKRRIDFYLCSFKKKKEIYQTSELLIANGAIPLYNISTESAYAKLLTAVNLFDNQKEQREFMKKNIYFEEVNEI